MTQIETRIMEITPEQAEEWLDSNEFNRKLDAKRVRVYASAMRLGAWRISNDDICIDINGKLLNGQHRLHAVIEAGVPVQMSVKLGMPTDAITIMDRGKTRKYSDHLRFRGEQSVALLAATLRLSLQLHLGMADGGIKGDADHDLFLAKHPEIRHSVRMADKLKPYIVAATPSSISSAHWMIRSVQPGGDVEPVDRYFTQLAHPTNQPEGSPILAVNGRLVNILQHQVRYQSRDYVYLFVQGWNLYATGERAYNLRRLRMRRKADGPFSLPEIEQYGLERTPPPLNLEEYFDEVNAKS